MVRYHVFKSDKLRMDKYRSRYGLMDKALPS